MMGTLASALLAQRRWEMLSPIAGEGPKLLGETAFVAARRPLP